jgi:Flp pilus assembly protein TadD
MQEALEGKDLSRPQAPWPTLVKVEDWRRSLLPRELVRRVRPLVLKRPKDPWLRVYLADALFRADSVSGALAEGLKAARLDPGCCRILLEIGGQLAAIGRLDEAERFLAGAPAVVNAAAELALAQGLDRAGHTARAIEHYSRMSKQVANYSTDLLIGYGYERLGDTTQARQHYLRAVALLAKPVSEMAGFADLTISVASAERFLRVNGYQVQAQALRRDHRLGIYFNKNTGGGSSGR